MMILCRLSFLILIIPLAIGIEESAPKVESAHNNTSATKNVLPKEDNNTKKVITLPIEGGGTVVQPSNPSLLKENDAILIPKMPSEDFGEVPTKNKGKHVVGRTGAPVIPDLKEVSTKAPAVVQKSTMIVKLSPTTIKAPTPSTKPPHKPAVLRYEEGSSIIADKSSHASATDGSSSNKANKPNSHPGMIMPIVITILVVPLFAVLGYMALKRGQEAWKNRHYKRMDFLLDGMYND